MYIVFYLINFNALLVSITGSIHHRGYVGIAGAPVREYHRVVYIVNIPIIQVLLIVCMLKLELMKLVLVLLKHCYIVQLSQTSDRGMRK